MGIAIRALSAEHICGLEKIENECFSEPWSKKSLEELLDCSYAVYFVAEDEERGVVGYGGMYVLADTGAINNIGVLSEYRRCGIASRLLEALITASEERGLCDMTLEVRQSNLAAIGLYEKYGFKKDGIRRNYYKKPTENAVLYTLTLR